MGKKYIATTENGKKVYVDFERSHASTHLLDTPQLYDFARELIGSFQARDDNIYQDKDMGRIVGASDLVRTTERDDILYAKRLNRDNYTRFVKGRPAEPTRFITIALQKNSDGTYDLFSAWIGRTVPQFPGDIHETPDSRPFWRSHALVWGNQKVQSDTETRDWPWD